MRGTATHLPTKVEWVLWDGSNFGEVREFVNEDPAGGTCEWQTERNGGRLLLRTQEGDRWPMPGDRITRGVESELYLIHPSRWGKLFGNVVVTQGG